MGKKNLYHGQRNADLVFYWQGYQEIREHTKVLVFIRNYYPIRHCHTWFSLDDIRALSWFKPNLFSLHSQFSHAVVIFSFSLYQIFEKYETARPCHNVSFELFWKYCRQKYGRLLEEYVYRLYCWQVCTPTEVSSASPTSIVSIYYI